MPLGIISVTSVARMVTVIKDCPLNQDQHSQYHHRQNYHKGGYSPLKTNEPNSENTLATLAKAVNDLSLLLKEHTQKSRNSFQAQNNAHTPTSQT